MATVHRSTSLENKLSPQGCEERCADGCDEGKSRGSVRSSVSLEIYGLQREQRDQHVYFSNQEYYRRLEELKSAHLRNIADLERMYVSQAVERYNREGDRVTRSAQSRRLFSEGPVRRLQRINSQEELDFHDSSSGSDQSELCVEEQREVEMDKPQVTTEKDCTFERLMLSPDEPKKQKPFRFQPKNGKTKVLGLSGVKTKAKSKVTIPKPFQMMLREEERKRHKVRTRSEVELENSMLKRELEELRECKKQFRASPAPAHIHLPLFEVHSQRFSQRPAILGKCNPTKQPFDPPKQYDFLERERRKKEARIVAELGNFCPKEETCQFKARPMPRSVYGSKCNNTQSFVSTEGEATGGKSSPNSDLEAEPGKADNIAPEGEKVSKCPLSKPVKKQIEVSIEMVKEKPWSYIDPLRPTACNMCSPLQPTTENNNYISV